MFQSLSIAALSGIFVVAAAAIWVAGVKLSNTTDVLSQRFGLGQALGGVILLAIATNLPEIAITASAAWSGDVGVAVGNILGGIAIQTVVLVALDAFGMRENATLTYKAASLTLVIEGLLVVAVLIVAIMGTQLPPSLIAFRLAPGAALIAVLWVIGVWLIGRAQHGLPWQDSAGDAPDTQDKPKGHSQNAKEKNATKQGVTTTRAVVAFTVAAVVTLIAGVVLERAGDGIAGHIGMSGVLFGATILAAATSLPELSTGLASTKLGDYQLAMSDIFGGNAFLPVLFLLATIISGKAVLPQADDTDIYLAGLAILLTSVYLAGLIFRPKRRLFGMGVDSLAVLILYAVGTAGLFAIALTGRAGRLNVMAWAHQMFGTAHDVSTLQECARAVLIFAYGLVVVRLAGRRIFGKWAALDIIVSILVGSNLSRAMTGSAPLFGTLAATTLLIALHWVLGHLAARTPALSRLLEGKAVELGTAGASDADAQKHHAVTQADLNEALRQTGVDSVGETRKITLEPSGKITVLRGGPAAPER